MSGPDWTTIENALYTWAYTYSSSIRTIWKHPNAPQPIRPFIRLHIENISKIGEDSIGRPNSDAERTVRGTREFDVEIVYFGARAGVADFATTPVDALGPLGDLLNTLSRTDVQEAFRAGGFYFIDFDDAKDTSFLEEDHQVDRADALIHCRTSVDFTWGGTTPAGEIIEHSTIIGTEKLTDSIAITPITITVNPT